jgi:hypothetical protein
MSNKPNLLIIGAMKCGTTSLHHYLNMHPDIYMSEIKEIDYFIMERNYNKGMKWYKTNFPSDAIIRGESSQDYSKFHWWEGVPKRIFNDLGEKIKIIYIIRNPIERIISHYNELQYQNIAPRSLNAYLNNGNIEKNELVLTSSYGKQLAEYLEFFSIKNIKIIRLEDLKATRRDTLNSIFNFLSLEEINDDVFRLKSNASSEKKMNTSIGNFIEENLVVSKAKVYLSGNIKQTAKRILNKLNITKKGIKLDVTISEDTEAKLKEIFIQDLKLLKSLTNLDINYHL